MMPGKARRADDSCDGMGEYSINRAQGLVSRGQGLAALWFNNSEVLGDCGQETTP
jgi:hypothetical protein